MPLFQKRLAKTVITLLGMTIKEEFCYCNIVINTVAAYCHFQKRKAAVLSHKRLFIRQTSLIPSKKTSLQLTVAQAKKQALNNAILLVFTEKKTTICFFCLRKQSLSFKKRTYKFASLRDLTKHFKQKHLAYI